MKVAYLGHKIHPHDLDMQSPRAHLELSMSLPAVNWQNIQNVTELCGIYKEMKSNRFAVNPVVER